MNKLLIEGLKKNQLKGTVLNIISIDEYDAKIENSIVVGFYVNDIDPSNDLNRFIQKSPISLIDTDVSPAPNENGYYMVFVEYERNNNFYKNLYKTLENVKNLVDIDLNQWKFTTINIRNHLNFNKNNIFKYINI